MAKPKISSDWMAGCAGCHMSLLDIDERILAVAELADIRATPITDLKEPDASGVDVGILEGGINNSANEEVAIKMRKRCKTLVALGDCAVFGGVPAMRNFFTSKSPCAAPMSKPKAPIPRGRSPAILSSATMTKVRALEEVVPVDVFVPGCPLIADVIFYVLAELAQGRKPELAAIKMIGIRAGGG